jgi:hypothetical protein
VGVEHPGDDLRAVSCGGRRADGIDSRWVELGYSSWAAYCSQEFHMRKAHAYRLLQAAQVVNQLAGESPMGDSLKVISQVPESERLARELVPLLSNPQALMDV